MSEDLSLDYAEDQQQQQRIAVPHVLFDTLGSFVGGRLFLASPVIQSTSALAQPTKRPKTEQMQGKTNEVL